MSAVVEPVASGRGVLPVCLLPWLVNPYTLVSAWDMLEFYATPVFEASAYLVNLESEFVRALEQGHDYKFYKINEEGMSNVFRPVFK